jgi:hypothetical protein
MDPFEAHVRAALAYVGIEVDDTDLAVMRVVDATYGPELRALAAADLTGIWHEPDLDPARAPNDR